MSKRVHDEGLGDLSPGGGVTSFRYEINAMVLTAAQA